MSDQITSWLEDFRAFVHDEDGARAEYLNGRSGIFKEDVSPTWRKARRELDERARVLGLRVEDQLLPALGKVDSAIESALRACEGCGLTRHSVEFSLGFQGAMSKLPDETTRRLSTMCGHGMVSATLAKKMVEWVRSGRRTPQQACAYMARFCVCGTFNPARAERVLDEAAKGR